MKKIGLLLIILTPCLLFAQQNAGIGTTTPHGSAVLDVHSTGKGMLVPRLTSAQRLAISSVPAGLLVFDITTSSFWFYNLSAWKELTDGANDTWKKNGANTYFETSGNMGIGNSSPANSLYISKSKPDIGFYDDNQFSGFIEGDSNNLHINAYRKSLVNPNDEAGNLLLQTNSGGLPPFIAGNVGIGTTEPGAKLTVAGGSLVTTGSGHLQLGTSGSLRLTMDNQSIQARNGNLSSKLILQESGGGVQIGNSILPIGFGLSVNGGIQLGLFQHKLTRPVTGTADLLPMAAAMVEGGAVLNSANINSIAYNNSSSQWEVTLSSFNPTDATASQYIIIVSPGATAGNSLYGVNCFIENDMIKIAFRTYSVSNFTNTVCCQTFSGIVGQNYSSGGSAMSFTLMVYKF